MAKNRNKKQENVEAIKVLSPRGCAVRRCEDENSQAEFISAVKRISA